MSWSGCSATSESRLFISIRIAPSVAQLLQLRWVPWGAWMGSLLCVMSPSWPGGKQSHKQGGVLLGTAPVQRVSVMGTSGSGKSTLSRALLRVLGVAYTRGDRRDLLGGHGGSE